MCVVEGSTKTKSHESNWATGMGSWDCGTDKEKLQVALFSTKLFTEESHFFVFFCFFILIFSQMKAPDNMWFVAFQPSGS